MKVEADPTSGDVVSCNFLEDHLQVPEKETRTAQSKPVQETIARIQEYFRSGRGLEKIAVQPQQGTEFQRKVWAELQKIPAGETRTYGEIAEALGSPSAARAVGSACKSNPIVVLVPCHRAVHSSAKSQPRYSAGVHRKVWLQSLEGVKKLSRK